MRYIFIYLLIYFKQTTLTYIDLNGNWDVKCIVPAYHFVNMFWTEYTKSRGNLETILYFTCFVLFVFVRHVSL